MIPLFVEAAGLSLIGFVIGLLLSYLLSLHIARRNRGWND